MKDFDLEAAKRGAAVCTRGGFPVRIICWNMKCKSYGDMDRIVYLTDYTGDEHLSSCWLNGSYLTRGAMDKSDLMMRDDDYLEKLERGEYDHIGDKLEMVDPTVKENLTVENPVVKQNLTTDREYWRRVYAGQAMQGIFASDESHTLLPVDAAKFAVICADALIEELEKTEKQRPKL